MLIKPLTLALTNHGWGRNLATTIPTVRFTNSTLFRKYYPLFIALVREGLAHKSATVNREDMDHTESSRCKCLVGDCISVHKSLPSAVVTEAQAKIDQRRAVGTISISRDIH